MPNPHIEPEITFLVFLRNYVWFKFLVCIANSVGPQG